MIYILILVSLAFLSLAAILGGSQYIIRFITNLMMWITLTESLNTITGYTGRVDFGHVIFFGVGAYIMAISIASNLPWALGMILSALMASFFAFIIGYPTLRLHGAYFAIATWSFAEAIKQIVFNVPQLGGSFGLSVRSILSVNEILILMTLVAELSIFINIFIEKSKLGRALMAIREDELAATIFGINSTYYRTIAYVISSIPTSLAGSIYSIWIGYVYPGDVFHGLKTDMMFVMLLLGGAGNYIGPILGSIALSVSYEILWSFFSEQLYLVFLGAILIIIILLIPSGLTGLLKIETYHSRKIILSITSFRNKRKTV